MNHEILPFSVDAVRSPADLRDAAALRSESYGRHTESLRSALARPDLVDRRAGTLVLLVRDKATGAAVGTARMQFSHHGALPLDACVTLPPTLAQERRAEVTRLAIAHGADARVRLALFKACWQYCEIEDVAHLVIAARSAALLRIYGHLGMTTLTDDDEWINLPYAGNLPHRVRTLDMRQVYALWRDAQHPAMPFMVGTNHPDIHLPKALPLPLAA